MESPSVVFCCLCLCSHHTSRVSHHIFGEPNFYHVHCSRPAMPNHRILFSRFLKSFNTRATPEKYLPTMIFPPIGQSLEKTNRLLYICLDPVCQLINPFPSPPFANNAVVWTHHTRSSKPSYIWCIRRIWPD